MSRLSALIPPDAPWSPKAQEDAGNFRCEGCVACEDCKFCRDCQQCRACTYCEACVQCQGCVQSRRCVDCHASSDLQECRGCRGSSHLLLCLSCEDCVHCLGCVGLSNAQFCVLNQELGQAEYFAQVAALRAELETRAQAGWRIDRLGPKARFARSDAPLKEPSKAGGEPVAQAVLADGTCLAPAPARTNTPPQRLAPSPALRPDPSKVAQLETTRSPRLTATATAPDPQFTTASASRVSQVHVDPIPSSTAQKAGEDRQDAHQQRRAQEIEAQAQALAACAARNIDARLANLEQRRPMARAMRRAKHLAEQAQQFPEASLLAPTPQKPKQASSTPIADAEAQQPAASPKPHPLQGSHPQDPSRVSAWTPVQLPPRKRRKP